MHGAVCAHGQCGTQGVFTFFLAQRHRHDFADFTGFFQAYGFFNRDFIKRVHRHFNIADINIRAIGFYTDFNVIVHHALYRDQRFHGFSFNRHAGNNMKQKFSSATTSCLIMPDENRRLVSTLQTACIIPEPAAIFFMPLLFFRLFVLIECCCKRFSRYAVL